MFPQQPRACHKLLSPHPLCSLPCSLLPAHLDYALGRAHLEVQQSATIATMNTDSASLDNKSGNAITGQWLTATGNMAEQVPSTLYLHRVGPAQHRRAGCGSNLANSILSVSLLCAPGISSLCGVKPCAELSSPAARQQTYSPLYFAGPMCDALIVNTS